MFLVQTKDSMLQAAASTPEKTAVATADVAENKNGDVDANEEMEEEMPADDEEIEDVE